MENYGMAVVTAKFWHQRIIIHKRPAGAGAIFYIIDRRGAARVRNLPAHLVEHMFLGIARDSRRRPINRPGRRFLGDGDGEKKSASICRP